MNILLYSLIFPPDVCSNAYVFSDMAKEMKRQGHKVTVITTTPHYDEANAKEKKAALLAGKKNWYKKSVFEGMDVYHIDVAPKKGGIKQRLSTFYRFHHYSIKLLKEELFEADAVIAQTPPPIVVAKTCYKLAKKLGAKSILVLQDLWLDALIKKGKIPSIVSKILGWYERKQYNRVDEVCTISPVMAELIKTKLKDESKLHVIPNFVDMSLYHPLTCTEEMRQKYGVAENDFVVSYVGNIGNAQDLSPIIEYAKNTDRKNIRFIIAGNGTKEKYFRDMAKCIESITFLGYVSREETLQINAISDVCLVMLAKHVTETSFPSKIYTIMAMGKPLLITCGKNSAAGNFIQDNRLGWAVCVDNREEFSGVIGKLCCKPEELKIYGENAFNLAKKEYAQDVVIEKYIRVVRD